MSDFDGFRLEVIARDGVGDLLIPFAILVILVVFLHTALMYVWKTEQFSTKTLNRFIPFALIASCKCGGNL